MEYQFRRAQLGEAWQQSLLRTGLQYQMSSQVKLRAGYAWVVTFPYGQTPMNHLGLVYPEHRLYQGLITETLDGIIRLSSRYILEERFIGKNPKGMNHGFDYVFAWRARAQLRAETNIPCLTNSKHRTYLAIWDEVMIGFGKQVNQNIFDQNRLACIAGFQPGKRLKIEGGFFEQFIQVGRMVNNQAVFQYNTGVNLAANFEF
jgi:hypothetical protein